MKKTIKFHTDINNHGCGFGEFKRVSDTRWYLDTIAIANEYNMVISKIKIYDWLSGKTSKVTIKYNSEEQWKKFAMHFLTHFACYMKDIKVKL